MPVKPIYANTHFFELGNWVTDIPGYMATIFAHYWLVSSCHIKNYCPLAR